MLMWDQLCPDIGLWQVQEDILKEVDWNLHFYLYYHSKESGVYGPIIANYPAMMGDCGQS